MPSLQPDGIMALQSELLPSEAITWSGRPNSSVIFHKEDIFLIPFSILWGGFAIFWEGSVVGYWADGTRHGSPWTFGIIWGIPFVLIGQYLIWGRFVYDAWLKGRTYYAVTNRRVLAVQQVWSRKVVSAYLDSLPAVTKSGREMGPGTITFAPADSTFSFFSNSWRRGRRNNWSAWNSMSLTDIPIFRDIDDPDYVYRMVSDLRDKSRQPKPALSA